ncbi:MAG: PLD nuclease N-terminal domain-containing protein [Acholeplasmataceae bacterium]
MEQLLEWLPLLVPLFLVQLILAIYALITLKNTEHVRYDSRIMWILIIIFLNLFGPILFLVFGRIEDDIRDSDR